MSGSCYEKATELLARRPHFRRQLAQKLERRGYDADEIERTLDRLVELGFLDDRRAALDWVGNRLRRRPEGRRRLRAELARRGAPDGAISEALDTHVGDREGELARAAAEGWRRRGGTRREALARHLDRKGFGAATVMSVLESLDWEG